MKKVLKRISKFLPDILYLKIRYYRVFKKIINFKEPKTFNEKLQWLKIYDRNPVYTQMVDKYEVRKYISEKIGEEYLIPLLGVWNDVEEINFDKLPNQFVLKTTHDSGGIVICKDKRNFDREKAKHKLSEHLKINYYYSGREWPYKNVKPRIIAEKYISDKDGSLTDYKIHCFNGIPKLILVCKDRFKNMTEDFFSENWEHIDVKRPSHSNANIKIDKPLELKEMLKLSKVLSKDIPFVRVDFYAINERIYFGELTFYPAAGLEAFIPEKYDRIFGDWLNIKI